MLGKYRMVLLIYENDRYDAADGLSPLNNITFAVTRYWAGAFTVLRVCIGRVENYW